ncbi:phosphogluconate dehydratase [uncultured Cocleimonas sp.]|uniref:phosphogluconate dehydratase n=1 Tax=uncultured Cocleimonas sp. TaxID=1051587 RepID=UPI00262A4873|nr:phosphogluconate dehydratase [uncultured Cocleimonas sp.]
MNTLIQKVTNNIIERSKPYREVYLGRIADADSRGVHRSALGCSNLAHGFAACSAGDKALLSEDVVPNIAIVSAYNDMLSAHQPFEAFPKIIKQALHEAGATGQFAGGVPAMCDGVTQSQPGMELSLFSRDVIAQATAIALSHNMFDGALYLGVCDKIVPGLMIGALTFGHLPAVFVPGGPMPSGISNEVKVKVRQDFAQGKVDEKTLLLSESGSYHSPGTCTFYGTANSNQMLMEIMGLHLPGSSFVETNTPLRTELTKAASTQVLSLIDTESGSMGIGKMLDEKSFVNAVIGLLATGGSSNHTLHLIAMARAAGIVINWQDFHDLAQVIPLLTKLYPNGSADVNHFHRAGGMPVVMNELLENGLLHNEVKTIMGEGLSAYTTMPKLKGKAGTEELKWKKKTLKDENKNIVSTVAEPFSHHGGLSILQGNIGRSVIKTSALKPEHMLIEAPAEVFDSQEALQDAYQNGELNKDFVAVVRYQGPKSNGMPELHGLLPALGSLQDEGFKIAIITDGRMSGASGKVASAIHMTPEASEGGVIAEIEQGDMIRLDVENSSVELLVDPTELAKRKIVDPDLSGNRFAMGRELFATLRGNVSGAEEGASIFNLPGEESA